MAFSEAGLIFLALIFTLALAFLTVLMLHGRKNYTFKNTRKKRKKRKRATSQRHSHDHQGRTRGGPEENNDDEPYNPRGTIFW